jgi:opacity protein-like surface antigen
MKKILFTLLFATGLFVAQAQIQVGVGLGYGRSVFAGRSFSGGYHFNLRAGYHLDENWRVMADYIIEGNANVNVVSRNEINREANFAFGSKRIRPYGLAGLNMRTVKYEFRGPPVRITNYGLNLGGGLQYFVAEKIALYGEARYVVSQFNQLVIGAGVVFRF